MKRIVNCLLCFLFLISLCACSGSYNTVALHDALPIPENGVIEASLLNQLQKQNAIGIFYGESNGIRYEWTIFGSDITEAKDISLLLSVTDLENEISIDSAVEEPFGFPALLSVYLNGLWDAQSATVYQQEAPLGSVSLSGTSHTILNLSLTQLKQHMVIRPDPMSADTSEGSLDTSAASSPAHTDEYLSSTSQKNTQLYQSSQSSPTPTTSPSVQDSYLSSGNSETGRVYSDGTATEKDQWLTDPIPTGKPLPVEPEDQEVDRQNTYTCSFSIECSTILNNLDMLDPDKLDLVPSDGVILPKTKVTFYEGESVFEVLQRVCKEEGIHLESSWTPIYNSAYIEGIHNLYEFDCGDLSGWMYRVNGWYPNYGCSRYQLQQGDVVQWRFTCDLGNDIGGGEAVGG